MKSINFKNGILIILILFVTNSWAQTVPVTFHLDANNTQYQSVQMFHWPDYYTYMDSDGDNVYELNLELNEGTFGYHVLRDNAFGCDPHNPILNTPEPTSGVHMVISDPMISYLLPKDGDMMRENRIRADFAYSAANPPLDGSISVNINGNNLANPASYYNTSTRILQIDNPAYLVEGENTVVVSYQTNKGSISRTSTFSYHSLMLMIDTITYRMDSVLAWGRSFETPYPTTVAIQSNETIYEANVNTEGYFSKKIGIQNGTNTIKVALNEAGLSNPVDQMQLNAEIRHKWWVELTGSITDNTATITTTAHNINTSNLTYSWGEETNPESLGISGNSESVSFSVPSSDGEYIIKLDLTNSNGQSYTAKKMLIVEDGTAHFLGLHERAPWMETMSIYEVEQSYLDHFTFQNLKVILPHMKKMGLNTFRITPFVLGGFISYDHFEIFPEYGSEDDLKDLIATAHQYGIKVLFDVPLSHVCPYHPFIYPNFLVKDANSPYYNFTIWEGTPGESDIVHSPDNGRQCVYTDLDNAYTTEYFYKLVEYWVEVFGVDGYRFDCGQESFLRAPEFATNVLKRLKNINPNIFILNEGDNRTYPDVNYYDYGDACYDWTLNTQWGGGPNGLPGMFRGTYTTDQLHELLTTGTPDKGLVTRYANSGYHDYFHDIHGWEEERTAFAIVSTSYGLNNIFQGEEVGGERSNGIFDYSDPLGTMPFYYRLIKMRKNLLGNYPEVSKLNISNGNEIYAYTSKNENNLVLTIANFTASSNSTQVSLSDPAFYGTNISKWYDVINKQLTQYNTETQATISLNAWETKVFIINLTEEDIFPTISQIEIRSLNNTYEITQDKGTLNLIALKYPESTLGDIEWTIEGDTHLATINDGQIESCGCGEGSITVIAQSVDNPSIFDQKTITITNQTSGQVTNSTFDSNVNYWSMWSPDCNNSVVWDDGKAKVVFGDNGTNCWSQLMSSDHMTVEQGKTYLVSFDAYASVNKTIYCKVRENGNNYADLSNEPSFNLTTTKQTYSFKFTASQATSHIGHIHFNFGGNNEYIWIDNVSFCESEPDPQVLTIKEIQGTTDTSPYEGQLIETEGEVTQLNEYGCFIQDANDEYSGIFVYHAAFSTLTVGDGLRIRGTVDEYNGLTEIKDIEWSETFTSSYNIVPLVMAQESLSEKHESLLVKATNVEAIEEDSYSNWLVNFSNDVQILIDNKYYEHELTAGNFYNITGIVYYRFDRFGLNPRSTSDIEDLGAPNSTTEITFQVNMENEDVSTDGVHVIGSWDNWTQSNELSANNNVYSATLELTAGNNIEYKFVNGLSSNNSNFETISGNCVSGSGNRQFTVSETANTLDLVCFGSCDDCETETAINTLSKDGIKIYPNPAKDIVYVDLQDQTNVEIILTDVLGRKLYQESADEKLESIQLENYQSGIYFLIIDNGTSSYNFKLLVK